jgi:YHS domain-containing protein
MVRDPVCLVQMDPDEAEFVTEYRGQTYYFDSEDCKEEFDADPSNFAGKLAEARYGDLPYGEPEEE